MSEVYPWEEVGSRVHRRRYFPLDISVTVIEGADGLLLVDTRRDRGEADEIVRDVAIRFDAPLQWVANTHAHHDHSFGNQRFGATSDLPLPIYGHRNLAAHYDEYERPRLAAFADGTLEEPTYDWRSVVLTPPTHEVSTRMSLDIGGRDVELIPVGPAHTDGDMVVFVPDARVWLMGDIIEHTFPPTFGTGCHPLRWADSLDALIAEMQPADVLIPGHGEAVDTDYARRQAGQIRWVAERMREAHEQRLRPDEAVSRRTDWPFPDKEIVRGMARAFSQLDQDRIG